MSIARARQLVRGLPEGPVRVALELIVKLLRDQEDEIDRLRSELDDVRRR